MRHAACGTHPNDDIVRCERSGSVSHSETLNVASLHPVVAVWQSTLHATQHAPTAGGCAYRIGLCAGGAERHVPCMHVCIGGSGRGRRDPGTPPRPGDDAPDRIGDRAAVHLVSGVTRAIRSALTSKFQGRAEVLVRAHSSIHKPPHKPGNRGPRRTRRPTVTPPHTYLTSTTPHRHSSVLTLTRRQENVARQARVSPHASLAAAPCSCRLLYPKGALPPHAAHIHQRGSLWTTIFIVDTIDPLCPGLLSRAQAPTQHDARHDNLCPVLLRVAHWMMPAWMAQRATGAPVQGVAAGCESDSHALRRVHEASPN